MRIFGSMAAAINTTAFLFHQEKFRLSQGLALSVSVQGSPLAAHFLSAATFFA